MDDAPRRESGEFDEQVSDETLLEAVREHDPAATAEVADAVGVTRQAADYRLRRLAEEGRVEKKKIAASLVWSPVTTAPTPGDGGTPDAVDVNVDEHGGREESPTTEGRDDERHGAHREAVEALDLEGAGSRLEAREATLVEILDYLAEHGSARAGELKALVDAEGTGYEDVDSFWSNIRRQDVFAELPVETPGRGGKEYRYAAE